MSQSILAQRQKVQHPGSWWADPVAQRDRAVFASCVREHLPRMLADTRASRMVDALVTAQWQNGGPLRGRQQFVAAGSGWSAQ